MKKRKTNASYILHCCLLLCLLGIIAALVMIGIKTYRNYRMTAPKETAYAAKSVSFSPPGPVDDPGSGTIDINSAGPDELTQLPGIGESRAQDIIDYRENVSPFFYPIDLTCVSGIGTATFEKMESLLCVSTPAP